jgi:predicted Zn-dependent protease
LRPTPYGWPTLASWCVWIEPGATTGPAALWDQRWLGAVAAALASWEQVLPIQRAVEPGQAQILIWRRKPRLQNNRASHGRAELELVEVERSGQWQIEPLVTVVISPGQAQTAIQATALHELGHAFGLWGHSEQASDVMAVSPGAKPLLQLSARDRATLGWLYRQQGLNSGGVRPAAGPALPAPGAN